jgi:hypothetical protein
MPTKQTAVEWLYEKLPLMPNTIKDFEFNEEILAEAKEIFSAQIAESYKKGMQDASNYMMKNLSYKNYEK